MYVPYSKLILFNAKTKKFYFYQNQFYTHSKSILSNGFWKPNTLICQTRFWPCKRTFPALNKQALKRHWLVVSLPCCMALAATSQNPDSHRSVIQEWLSLFEFNIFPFLSAFSISVAYLCTYSHIKNSSRDCSRWVQTQSDPSIPL